MLTCLAWITSVWLIKREEMLGAMVFGCGNVCGPLQYLSSSREGMSNEEGRTPFVCTALSPQRRGTYSSDLSGNVESM